MACDRAAVARQISHAPGSIGHALALAACHIACRETGGPLRANGGRPAFPGRSPLPLTCSQWSPRSSVSMFPNVAPTSTAARRPVAFVSPTRSLNRCAAGSLQPYDHASPSATVRRCRPSLSVKLRLTSIPARACPRTVMPASGLAKTYRCSTSHRYIVDRTVSACAVDLEERAPAKERHSMLLRRRGGPVQRCAGTGRRRNQRPDPSECGFSRKQSTSGGCAHASGGRSDRASGGARASARLPRVRSHRHTSCAARPVPRRLETHRRTRERLQTDAFS